MINNGIIFVINSLRVLSIASFSNFNKLNFKTMAKIIQNLYLQGARGMLGKQLVYRTVNGVFIVSTRPIRRAELTEAQKRQNKRFKYATIYGKSILNDPEIGPIYQAAASELNAYRSAYQLAVTDYLRVPEIEDLTYPSGEAGTVLLVEAFEDPQLAKVTFSILDAADEILETGDATLQTNGIQWAYRLQKDVPEAGKVKVDAYDFPGNIATKMYEL